MLYRDFVWECDYGERGNVIESLARFLDTQNPRELGMCALFVNNSPYNLEFYVVLGYKNPRDEQVKIAKQVMSSCGARHKSEVTFKELMKEVGRKRFCVYQVVDSEHLKDMPPGLFFFKERNEIASVISTRPLGGRLPVFLSHASSDKPFVEDVIPYLAGGGLPVWCDTISIDYGQTLVSAIQEGIKTSGAVLFYITRSFLRSSWCNREMEGFLTRYGGGERVLILAVVAPNVAHEELPFFVQTIKYFPLAQGHGARNVASEFLPTLKKHFKL